jgi:hypothetical protein
MYGLNSTGSEQGPMAGLCENINENLGSIKAGNFLAGTVTISFLRTTLHHGVSFQHFFPNQTILFYNPLMYCTTSFVYYSSQVGNKRQRDSPKTSIKQMEH